MIHLLAWSIIVITLEYHNDNIWLTWAENGLPSKYETFSQSSEATLQPYFQDCPFPPNVQVAPHWVIPGIRSPNFACRQCSGYSKERQTHFGFQSVQEDVKKEKVTLGVCKSFSRRYMSRCLAYFMPWQIHTTSWMMPCLLVYTECGRTTSLHRFTLISYNLEGLVIYL